MVAAGIVGADPFRVRENLVSAVSPSSESVSAVKAAWQNVVTLRGVGSTTASPFSVARGATRWRARWSCQTGHIQVQAAGRPLPVIDAQCPGSGTAFAGQTGTNTLQVTTTGSWLLDIDQKIPGAARTGT